MIPIWLWLLLICAVALGLGLLMMPFTAVTAGIYYLSCLVLGAGGTGLAAWRGWIK